MAIIRGVLPNKFFSFVTALDLRINSRIDLKPNRHAKWTADSPSPLTAST